MKYHERMYLPTAGRMLFLVVLYCSGMVVGSCVTRADLTAECRETGTISLSDGQHVCGEVS